MSEEANYTETNCTLLNDAEHPVSVYAAYVGSVFIILTLPGLLASLFCIWIVLKFGYLKKSAAAVYHPIFHLLICDTSQLIAVMAFGVLAAIGVSDSKDVLDIHGFLVCVFFHVNCSLLVLTAFNRYMSVCWLSIYNKICSRKNMISACFGTWFFSISVHATIFYLTPCCHFMVSYRHFTLKWRNPRDEFLYSDYFMHLPYDVVTIASVIVFYGLVVRKLRINNRSVVVKKSKDAEKRQAQEMRITVQFIIISLLVLPVPILLRLFPLILPERVLRELNIVLVTGAMANSSINALIYLTYNEDIKRKAKKTLGMNVPELTVMPSRAAQTRRATLRNMTESRRVASVKT